MTCISVVRKDHTGARRFSNIKNLQEYAKNNGLHFKVVDGKEDRRFLLNKDNKVVDVLYSFDHMNVIGKSDKTNPDAYHPAPA